MLNLKKAVICGGLAFLLLGIIAALWFQFPLGSKDKSIRNAQQYLSYKTDYIGDASKVGNILSLLKYPEPLVNESFELITANRPYKVIVYLKNNPELRYEYEISSLQRQLEENAILMFSLIGNADIVEFFVEDEVSGTPFQFTREWAEERLNKDVREFSQSDIRFAELLAL
ncbi:DUF4825 domain-containing protein [Bacillus sp. Marseille-P3661]|uniref:DUF4825 domain-containing protein n=1 Tax=Bacillus sp. Marseille-P3661 TaxID=1936234 RepID=UPI000C820555|nr:DUF4825 domain-containing protein [Bacillus sp. Marseille-P3661]